MANSEHITGQQLVILFEKCDDLVEDCKGKEEVKNIMRGKSIILYTEQRSFQENSEIDSLFVEESKFIWVPIGPEMIEDNFFSLQMGSVTTKDMRYKPFADTEEESWPMSLWNLQRGRTVGYKDFKTKPNVMAAVTIERDLNLYKVDRRVEGSYAVWFAMLGGVTVGLYVIVYALEYFMTFKSFQNYMASELYYIAEDIESTENVPEKDAPKKGCCTSDPNAGLSKKRM